MIYLCKMEKEYQIKRLIALQVEILHLEIYLINKIVNLTKKY